MCPWLVESDRLSTQAQTNEQENTEHVKQSAQIPSKLLPRFPSKNSEQTAKIEVGAIFAFTKQGFHDSQNIKLREKKIKWLFCFKKKILARIQRKDEEVFFFKKISFSPG